MERGRHAGLMSGGGGEGDCGASGFVEVASVAGEAGAAG